MTYIFIGVIWTLITAIISALLDDKRSALQFVFGVIFWPIDLLFCIIILIGWLFSLSRS